MFKIKFIIKNTNIKKLVTEKVEEFIKLLNLQDVDIHVSFEDDYTNVAASYNISISSDSLGVTHYNKKSKKYLCLLNYGFHKPFIEIQQTIESLLYITFHELAHIKEMRVRNELFDNSTSSQALALETWKEYYATRKPNELVKLKDFTTTYDLLLKNENKKINAKNFWDEIRTNLINIAYFCAKNYDCQNAFNTGKDLDSDLIAFKQIFEDMYNDFDNLNNMFLNSLSTLIETYCDFKYYAIDKI